MDIEGGESGALKGAVKLLEMYRPIVLVALHGEECTRFCPEFLKRSGYDIFDLQSRRIEGVPSTDEIYAFPTNGTAIDPQLSPRNCKSLCPSAAMRAISHTLPGRFVAWEGVCYCRLQKPSVA